MQSFFLVFSLVSGLADLLAAVSNKIARDFNRFKVIQVVARDIFKAFDRIRHACLLYKRKSYGISGQVFGHSFSFLSNRLLKIVLNGKFLQEYSVKAAVFLKAPFLVPHLS